MSTPNLLSILDRLDAAQADMENFEVHPLDAARRRNAVMVEAHAAGVDPVTLGELVELPAHRVSVIVGQDLAA